MSHETADCMYLVLIGWTSVAVVHSVQAECAVELQTKVREDFTITDSDLVIIDS